MVIKSRIAAKLPKVQLAVIAARNKPTCTSISKLPAHSRNMRSVFSPQNKQILVTALRNTFTDAVSLVLTAGQHALQHVATFAAYA